MEMLDPTLAIAFGLTCLAAAAIFTSEREVRRPTAQMQAVLDELSALGPLPIETLSPEEARRQPGPGDAVQALLQKRGDPIAPEEVASIQDWEFAGREGSPPIRVYTPHGEGPFPILVFWHGGGWVIGSLDAYDASCRALARSAGCIVASCEYRRAPEHPFPAAVDDAFAAYLWVIEKARGLGGDPKRIAVGGESAGGNLATVTAIRARNENAPAPVHQLLIYPVTNHFDFSTPSYQQYAHAKPLNQAMMKWFSGHYLSQPSDAENPYASPLRATDLAGLPSATIITAEIDPLQSEAQAYAMRLAAAGVNVTYRNFEGVTHEFFGMGAVLTEARQAVTLAADGLKAAFAA